ncbi:hypothetical protein AX16_005904 [Volvariella volvacea WC 439]|nr:hypothetical protein AX16_005904 [Volvariella volvacea WC 439]
MLPPQCSHCFTSGAKITQLLIRSGIFSILVIPVVTVVNKFNPFILPAPIFNLLHVALYLSLLSSGFNKSKRNTEAGIDGGQHTQNPSRYIDAAYRPLFELPHVIISVFDALLWMLALAMSLYSLFYRAKSVSFGSTNSEDKLYLTLIVYRSVFVLSGAVALWNVVVIAIKERNKRKSGGNVKGPSELVMRV